LLRRAFGEHLAVVEHANAVGEVGDHLHVVLDPDHGEAEFVLDAQDVPGRSSRSSRF
jgi:hypothetical protein